MARRPTYLHSVGGALEPLDEFGRLFRLLGQLLQRLSQLGLFEGKKAQSFVIGSLKNALEREKRFWERKKKQTIRSFFSRRRNSDTGALKQSIDTEAAASFPAGGERRASGVCSPRPIVARHPSLGTGTDTKKMRGKGIFKFPRARLPPNNSNHARRLLSGSPSRIDAGFLAEEAPAV